MLLLSLRAVAAAGAGRMWAVGGGPCGCIAPIIKSVRHGADAVCREMLVRSHTLCTFPAVRRLAHSKQRKNKCLEVQVKDLSFVSRLPEGLWSSCDEGQGSDSRSKRRGLLKMHFR